MNERDELWERYTDVLGAALRLHIHPRTVGKLITRGRLPTRRFASKHLIERTDLERFAATYYGKPGRQPARMRLIP